MDTPLDIQDEFPFENIILAYLQNQQVNDVEEYIPPSESPSQKFVREFLEELIWKVEKQTAWRERYRQLESEHNQNFLFEIMDYIPEFFLDDTVVQKLTFRENLIICSIDQIPLCKQVGTLNAVGGLVLDIQWAEGKVPRNFVPDCDTFEKQLLETCKKIKECKSNITPHSLILSTYR
ncbi:unnamed protein product [Brassicogethes aeneus]|uniref:Uncharacterized protein n=1 Tax=Brassicogethes aeneus TaxID=1431903 RepID=A0A9P0AUY5_BRAAE|nr:unnamed protein product [Brassicogethes aeneus]